MSYIGRKLRQSRLFYRGEKKGLIVPIDHGLTMGPISGLESPASIKNWIGNPDISAVITHKGMLEQLILHDAIPSTTGVVAHLNGMSQLNKDADTKRMVADVDSVVQLGADAVSVQVNFTAENTAYNIELLGHVTDKAHALGLPLLAMLYDKEASSCNELAVERMRSILRIAVELGCDALKIGFPQNDADIPKLLEGLGDVTHVFFAGGERTDEQRFLDKTAFAVASGAAGLCAGRNVFQHAQKELLLSRLARVILDPRAERAHAYLDDKVAV